jgi:hypothetical protein
LFITIFVVSLCLSSNANELPSKLKLKDISIHNTAYGKNIVINGSVQLPQGQKLNDKAPNYLSIYEKTDKSWELVKKVNLNNRIAIPGMDLIVNDEVQLKNSDSKIAIDATIYHCALDNRGVCYIDDFQKHIQRYKSATNELSFTLHPTMK